MGTLQIQIHRDLKGPLFISEKEESQKVAYLRVKLHRLRLYCHNNPIHLVWHVVLNALQNIDLCSRRTLFVFSFRMHWIWFLKWTSVYILPKLNMGNRSRFWIRHLKDLEDVRINYTIWSFVLDAYWVRAYGLVPWNMEAADAQVIRSIPHLLCIPKSFVVGSEANN